jgi:hypothetical protein
MYYLLFFNQQIDDSINLFALNNKQQSEDYHYFLNKIIKYDVI